MDTSERRPALLALAGVAHLVVTAWAWRDLQRRPAAQLRGSRALWRVLTALNTGNSLVYALVGIRR